jgi:hypothetical protein
MSTVQNTQNYFNKQFQSLTMITQLELWIADGVSVILVSPCPPGSGGRLPNGQIEPSSEVRKTCVVTMVLSVEERMCTEIFIALYKNNLDLKHQKFSYCFMLPLGYRSTSS